MAAQLTSTGTWTQPDVKGQDVGGSGVTFRNVGGDDFDSRACIKSGKNLFDEAQQFVALVAANCGMSASAAIDQLAKIFADLRRNPSMGERFYQQ